MTDLSNEFEETPWTEDENPESLAGKELTDEELKRVFEEEAE
jgi:hypothetical protein